MTFIEFIKSKVSVDDSVGDLARDMMNDGEFPIESPNSEVISYLDFKTKLGGTNEVFKDLLMQYEIYLLDSPSNDNFSEIIDSTFTVFKAEKWQLYKKHYSIDKVYLIGKISDIYRVYCENIKNGKAICLDIKSGNDLNNIVLIDTNKIPKGEFTQLVTVNDAISKLENCKYETSIKPVAYRFNEILEFLKLNIENKQTS